MPERRKGMPWVWVTWVTGLMADEDHCRWAAWFKGRFKYKKAESDFDSVEYKAKHKIARDTRAEELRAAGYKVLIEGEVDFTIKGGGLILAGRPDIVAIDHDKQEILVEDPKTGQRYLKHWYQLGLYLRWIKRVLPKRYAHYSVRGALLYYDVEDGVATLTKRVAMEPAELTPDVLQVMNAELQVLGMDFTPEKTPSPQECLYCNIPIEECPEKQAERAQPVEETDF